MPGVISTNPRRGLHFDRKEAARDWLGRAASLAATDRWFALLNARIALAEGRPRDAVGPLEQALKEG